MPWREGCKGLWWRNIASLYQKEGTTKTIHSRTRWWPIANCWQPNRKGTWSIYEGENWQVSSSFPDHHIALVCLDHSLYSNFYVYIFIIRWVSVVEFHDGALGIGKVFGQESTVVRWNYQIFGLHQVTVRQKLGVILIIKWF